MFIQRLKELRASIDISQASLAEAIGVSQQAVAKWETDKATPDPYMIVKIAQYFNVSTDFLLGVSSTTNHPENKDISSDLSDDEQKIIEAYRTADNKEKRMAEYVLLSKKEESKKVSPF